MRKKWTVMLAGLMLALTMGNGLASETATVSTADSQLLPKDRQLVADPLNQASDNHSGMEEPIVATGKAVRRPMLHWDSMENAQRTGLAEKSSAAPLVVVHNAVPIIITAADVEARDKVYQTTKTELAPVATIDNSQPVKPTSTTHPSATSQDTVELPPIRAVVQLAAEVSTELPPIQAVPVARIVTIQTQLPDTVELPPVQPVK